MSLAFFEVEDQHAKLHVRGVERDEFARVSQCGRKIASLSRDRDEGQERVSIRRMAFVGSFEQFHRRCASANRIQRDRVDIARIAGRKLAGLPQFRDRIGVIVLTHEPEAERVANIRIVRITPPAQKPLEKRVFRGRGLAPAYA
jgi:hypothetical protein